MIHERRAQLVQPGERELNLGLDARRPRDGARRGAAYQVLEERGLPDSGLATQHQRPAWAGTHARDEVVARRAFAAPAKKRCRCHGWRLRAGWGDGNQGGRPVCSPGAIDAGGEEI
jgi:hypothetical protein